MAILVVPLQRINNSIIIFRALPNLMMTLYRIIHMTHERLSKEYFLNIFGQRYFIALILLVIKFDLVFKLILNFIFDVPGHCVLDFFHDDVRLVQNVLC